VKNSTINNVAPEERIAWRPTAWLKAAGHPFSRPTLYREIHAGRIDARKVGRFTTLILTPPLQYLQSLPRELGPAVGTAKRIRDERAKAAEGAAA
jgi:hypothetical protein